MDTIKYPMCKDCCYILFLSHFDKGECNNSKGINCIYCGKFMKIDWDKTFECMTAIIFYCWECNYIFEDEKRMNKLWDEIDKENGL